MNLIFSLFGKNTLEFVDLGHGPLFREHWAIQQHPGPRMNTGMLGGRNSRQRFYLYPHHLELLYGRFGQANPGGVSMGVDEVMDLAYRRAHGLTVSQADDLYERRCLFVTVTDTDEQLGYPHLKRYLPEVFEPEVVAAMEMDSWLNAHLLEYAIGRGEVPDSRVRHPRWSPEWRAYCDRLGSSAGLV